MKFPATLKRLIDGKYHVRCVGTVVGDVSIEAPTREEAVEKAKQEIRYRLEWCPCSAVSDEFVELDLRESAPSPWRGSVF
jgi:hypothetical protein